MVEISSSIMCADFSRLAEEVSELEKAGVDLFHFDINDGNFVPTITMGPLLLNSLRNKSDLPFEVHLQITNPQHHIKSFLDAGADFVIVHLEASIYPFRIVEGIKKAV